MFIWVLVEQQNNHNTSSSIYFFCICRGWNLLEFFLHQRFAHLYCNPMSWRSTYYWFWKSWLIQVQFELVEHLRGEWRVQSNFFPFTFQSNTSNVLGFDHIIHIPICVEFQFCDFNGMILITRGFLLRYFLGLRRSITESNLLKECQNFNFSCWVGWS